MGTIPNANLFKFQRLEFLAKQLKEEKLQMVSKFWENRNSREKTEQSSFNVYKSTNVAYS